MQDKGSGFIDGVISSDTRGRGDGGTMKIKAEVLELDGGQINTRSGWFSPITSGGGKAGSIGIEAEEVRMSNGAKISSLTWTQGDGGVIRISGGTLVLSGERTSINTYSAYGTSAQHEEGKGGTGGKIEIGVKEVQVVDGSNISASSRGSGDAGSVKLDSESIWVDGEGSITSSSGSKDRGTRFGYDLITTGDAGSIEINSKSLVVGNSGLISVSTLDEGQGGELAINADSVKIHEKGKLLSNTYRKGNGGNILIESSKLEVTESGEIESGSEGDGNAGSIHIGSGKLEGPTEVIITEEGRVTASTLGKGKAGGIVVKAGEIRLEAGKIFSDSKSKGDGGDAGVVELEGEVINILANARVGFEYGGQRECGCDSHQWRGGKCD